MHRGCGYEGTRRRDSPRRGSTSSYRVSPASERLGVASAPDKSVNPPLNRHVDLGTPVSPTPDVPNPLTLSQAITEADAASGPVTISFDLVPKNIPGVVNFDLTNQVWTFDVSTPLPAITSPYPVTIDGYTQSYVTSGDGAMGDGRWAMGDGDGDMAMGTLLIHPAMGDGRWGHC